MIISAGNTTLVKTDAIPLTPKVSPQVSTASFAQKLAGAIEALLHQSGTGARIQVQIEQGNAPESGERQFVVTVTESASSTASTTASANPAPASAQPVTLMSIPIQRSSSQTASSSAEPAAANSAPTGPRLANGKLVTNEYEAYWASQPAEVQQIMNAPNEGKRMELAQELAAKGYLIDVPIMVWGWDPLSTMIVRRNQGYTWVPSAQMDPVKVAPGVNFPGLVSYNPDNPPAGSIRVSIDWAKGFEHTCPWYLDPEESVTA